MLVRFYLHPVPQGDGPDGLPLFRDVEYITINRDSTHTISRRVNDDDKKKFREMYEAFRESIRDTEKLEGFPLDMWAALKPSQVTNLKLRGIHTVQQLAQNGDQNPLMQEVAKKAKVFLKLNAGGVMAKKFEELTEENALLKSDLKDALDEAGILRSKLKETAT